MVDYLKIHIKMGCINYDSMDPNIDFSVLNNNANWTVFYREVEKDLPPKFPDPRVRAMIICLF